MDTYLEYMIKKKKTVTERLFCISCYLIAAVLTVVLAVVHIPFITLFYPALVFLMFYGAYKFSRRYSIEYEYILTNDELDVDRILAKKERKRLLTVSVRKFEVMAPAQGEEFVKAYNSPDLKVKLNADLGEGSENRYYAVFVNKKSERMILVFNPTNEMLDSMKKYNMRNIQLGGN